MKSHGSKRIRLRASLAAASLVALSRFSILQNQTVISTTQKAFLAESHAPQHSNKKIGTNVGQRYFDLIDESDLSEAEKTVARIELAEVIQEVKRGKTQSFRMKIRGIHCCSVRWANGWTHTSIKK